METESMLNRLLLKISNSEEEYGVIVKKRISNGQAVAQLSIVCNNQIEIKSIYKTMVTDKSMEKAVKDAYAKALEYVFKVGLYTIREVKFV